MAPNASQVIECRITSTQSKSGTFEIGTSSVPQNLHFVDGAAPNGRGSVTTGGADVSMIVPGDVLMDSNTFINGSGLASAAKVALSPSCDPKHVMPSSRRSSTSAARVAMPV